ncbi:MAG: his Kinase domain protein [Ramlibacter sp.]|jgi:signal transduction histidine kinase|nr:his Kinase domain protein [Ramlibacter sp.]MDB5911371.1 his Kinase domain protein [Ramlibacter sp.]
MKYAIASLRVTRDNLVEIRDSSRAIGELFGLDKLVCTRFITAVSEIARNAAQHAVDGAVTFFLDDGAAAGGQHVVAEVTDRGPGIRDLPAAMAGVAHGRRPAGQGLASSKRLADTFSVEPVPGGGTLVSIGMARPRGARPLRPEEITGLLDVLSRRKTRSPLEEVEQQNLEMLHTLQALKDRQGELELADQRKNQFVATLAHELRNPLGTLQMTLHILRHKPEFQAPELVGHLAVMSRQAQQLHRLVTDLMDVSRVSQGKVQLHKQPTDLNEMVSQALEMTGAAIKAKEHQVELSLCPEKLWVDADATRIKQVLSNIMHNAARYSPDHGRIAVRVKRADADAVVEVSDSGMGIAPDVLPHVFGLFVQGSHHTDGGLGVGLALAQRLVHDHDGTISAASGGRGRGSQFTVKLPLCPARTLAESPAP